MNERVLHCWSDYRESLEYGSPEWLDTYGEGGNATCMLPDGHDGPHEWTRDGDIGIDFRENE